MSYLLLAVSMMSTVIKNSLFNNLGKKMLKKQGDIYKFNAFMYIFCILIFFFLSIKDGVSVFTVSLGVVFGILTVLANFYSIKALSSGPMHITILITTSSMIIPTIGGAFIANEPISLYKMLVIVLLIGFIYLSAVGGTHEETQKANKKWIIYCLITFLSSGIIGILQKIHQGSSHRKELFGFLFCAFLCSFIYSIIGRKQSHSESSFGRKHYILALICGICIFAMNYLNLYLSGVMPSQIFFPLVNGGSIILSSLCSLFIFREEITVKQIIGLIGGIISLVGICLL